ncbi:VanZ family protein [Gaetbulibacter saemankumensis]|uniref:VanZ family protein n=1 Tax=Gaetbulibacter saemankumensis TaxID=311208 RepID=UPI00146F8F1A|nr:VanZ family protein [Gaetbulibacter saemankumensis]
MGVSFADKIFHIGSYLTLCILWFYSFLYKFKFEKNSALIYASVFAFFFGIIIEVLQGVLTESRASDFYDVVANSLGILVGVIFILIIQRRSIKKL